jgi:maleylpyruvate isomerase
MILDGRRHETTRSAVDSDPESLRGQVDEATARLEATADGVTDEQARAPSLLPGWSRGHVLAHLARNADALRNLLIWARTGVRTPMYATPQARDEEIEAGAGRPAAELAAGLRESAGAFAREASGLPAGSWNATVRGMDGPEHPAWFVLVRRLGEVEIHHVDLGLAYRPPDWPPRFVADELERTAGRFAGRDGVPPCVLEAAGTGQRFVLGPAGAAGARDGEVIVSGPGGWLLAWLIGRDPGTGLSVRAGQEPAGGAGGPHPKLPKLS